MDTNYQTAKAKRKDIDWDRVGVDFREGAKTLRQIADEHGCTHAAVMKRAKKNGWDRGSRPEKTRAVGGVSIGEAIDGFAAAGFIYVMFIEAGGERFFKIGMASHLDSRMKSHQCSSPFEVVIAIAYFVGNMRKEERVLHELFASKRVRGEWFRLDACDLNAIASRSLLVSEQ